jgi:CRISPR-associated protein Cas1
MSGNSPGAKKPALQELPQIKDRISFLYDVARKMYALRFAGEDVSKMTMQQLRGREGARMRGVYRHMSKKTGVPWNGREYNPDDFEGGDAINMALSSAHLCLYGVAHSVIVALGCSPGLGFVHTGHERSFVFDIADLYKAEITIPIAFEVAARAPEDIGSATRRAVRDVISDGHILKRAARDIRGLLLGNAAMSEVETEANILRLWDEKNGFAKSAVSYGKEFDDHDEEEEGYGTLIEGE